MQKNISKKSTFYHSLLSILLHLLLILTFTMIMYFQPEKIVEKSPHFYTPAYTYTGAMTPHLHSQSGHESHRKEAISPDSNTGSPQKSILALSKSVLHQDQIKTVMSQLKNVEPILLIGDTNTPPDPLIKMMARSLSAHFKYPQFEGNIGARGRVIVSLVLHPEGYFSDIQIMRSSDNQNFDAAALYTINKAPLVNGANMFISQPKYFVIGFIFY